jgi:GT2 family glycosyltransferase
MDLSIIIINWNSKNFLRECLLSIGKHTTGVSYEIIVIDNASFDGAAELLALDFPQVKYIQSAENLGFARGNNRAAQQASGNYLLFLNPDTEILSNAIGLMFQSAKALPDAGVLGARLLNTDCSLQTSCVQSYPRILNQLLDSEALRNWFPESSLWGTAVLYERSYQPLRVEGISGACMLISHEVFWHVSGFSEEYFMYYEDMDLCRKVQRAGRRNYLVPGAEVVHHGGKSSGGASTRFSSIMMAESAWRYFAKEHGAGWALLFRLCLAGKAFSRSILLSLAYVAPASNSRRERLRRSLRKWTAVFRWAIGSAATVTPRES